MRPIEIVDCTFRDGGNVNAWGFSPQDFDEVIPRLGKSVDLIEVGYRGGSGSNRSADVGAAAVCTDDFLARLSRFGMRLAVMVVPSAASIEILSGIADSGVEVCRIATYPKDVGRALEYVSQAAEIGLEARLNLMAAGYVELPEIRRIGMDASNAGASTFCLADSFGGLTPRTVTDLVSCAYDGFRGTVGFHGHNNLGLSMANVVAALEAGATSVDSALRGLARGAGNVPTEVLVPALIRMSWRDSEFQDLQSLFECADYIHEVVQSGGSVPLSKREIECGLANAHYYLYPSAAEAAALLGVSTLEILSQVGERRLPAATPEVVRAVVENWK